MDKTIKRNSDSIILTDSLPTNSKSSQQDKIRKVESKVIVSCQDIRNLVSTLYLRSLPGLEDIVTDFDILIDEYYEPIRITD